MNRIILHSAILAVACGLMLSSCGGSGTIGNPSPSVPTPGGGGGPTPHASATPSQAADANFAITIPGPASQAARSRRFDFSASTQSVTIALNGQTLSSADVSPSSSSCVQAGGGGRRCIVGVNAPAGTDTFTITAYDESNGTGNILAKGTLTGAVSPPSVASFDVSVNGVIAQLALSILNPNPPAGKAITSAVMVSGLDADGNTVLGSYTQPIALSDSDTSRATSLSASTVTGSAVTESIAYTGAVPFLSATITASMPGIAPVSATFAPTPAFLRYYSVPSPSVLFGPGVRDICLGSDGNMWVTAQTVAEIMKIEPDGTVSVFPLANPQAQPNGLVLGADGNLWFSELTGGKIAKITPSGQITEYKIPRAAPQFTSLTLGSDKNIWFTIFPGTTFGKITPSGAITLYSLPANSAVEGITSGSDGNIWLTDGSNNAIIKASTSGAILASYPVPTPNAGPFAIAAAPDGNLWFTESAVNKIGRISTTGTVSEYGTQSGSSNPYDIVAGPDHRMWYSEVSTVAGQGKVGYITLDGTQSRDFLNPSTIHVLGLAFNRKGNLWYVSSAIFGGFSEVGVFAI